MLLRYNPDIVCLQEVHGINIQLILQEMHYSHIIFSKASKTASFVPMKTLIASKYPIDRMGEIELEKKRKRGIMPFEHKALYGIFSIKKKQFLVYSCHFNPFGETLDSRRDVLLQVLSHAYDQKKPTILCGDLNTVIPQKRPYRMIFKLANKEKLPASWQYGSFAFRNEEHYFAETALLFDFIDALGVGKPTFRLPGVRSLQKLDWMLYKGVTCTSAQLTPWIGDHRGIFGTFIV